MAVGTGTEEYYRRRAPEYDRVYEKPERQADLAELRRLVRSLLAGRRVLEVAAGTGWWTDVYAGVVAASLATDVNPETLAVASARRVWPPTVRFAEHDAFRLETVTGTGMGTGTATFDAAFAGFFWSHVPLDRLDRFLDGLAGRLGAGGVMVFVDNRFVDASNHPVVRRDEAGNSYQRRRLDDGTQWEVLKNFPAPVEIQERGERLGARVAVTELDYYWLATMELPPA